MTKMRSVVWAVSVLAVSPASTLAQDAGGLRLDLNIPAYRLDVYEGSTRVRHYVVAVGEPAFPTPIGEFLVSRIEWNPWWIPPPVDWAKSDSVTPPGPGNPMGRVKLGFYDDYFIHGSPEITSLGSAASHGCVRMANDDAVDLATLVHRYASPDLSLADIDRLATMSPTDGTRRFALTRALPVSIRYELVELQAKQLVIYNDVYRKGEEPIGTLVLKTLARSGYDTVDVDVDRLEYALKRNHRPLVIQLIDLWPPADSLRPDRPAPLRTQWHVYGAVRAQPQDVPSNGTRETHSCRNQ